MNTNQIMADTKKMIDDLKTVCGNFGLGNAPSEYKIITGVFLYKYLNDKFLHEIRLVEDKFKKCENLEEELDKLSDDDYEIIGDFSELSYVGYNISNCHIKIKNEIRTMKELAYHYNMEKIKSTKLLFEKYHITYYNGMDYSSRVNLLSSMEV